MAYKHLVTCSIGCGVHVLNTIQVFSGNNLSSLDAVKTLLQDTNYNFPGAMALLHFTVVYPSI